MRGKANSIEIWIGALPSVEQRVMVDHFTGQLFVHLRVKRAQQLVQTLKRLGVYQARVTVGDGAILHRQPDALSHRFAINLRQVYGFYFFIANRKIKRAHH